MSEPESAFERLRRAQRDLGEPDEAIVAPIEETDEAAAAVEDEAPVPGLARTPPEVEPERRGDE